MYLLKSYSIYRVHHAAALMKRYERKTTHNMVNQQSCCLSLLSFQQLNLDDKYTKEKQQFQSLPKVDIQNQVYRKAFITFTTENCCLKYGRFVKIRPCIIHYTKHFRSSLV